MGYERRRETTQEEGSSVSGTGPVERNGFGTAQVVADHRDQTRELQPFAGNLREGREIVYRHVPREVLCTSCAGNDASVSYRPSLRWVRAKHPGLRQRRSPSWGS